MQRKKDVEVSDSSSYGIASSLSWWGNIVHSVSGFFENVLSVFLIEDTKDAKVEVIQAVILLWL